MSKNSTFFIGLDLGDKFSYVTTVDGEGDLIEETRLPTSKSALRRKFSNLPSSRVAMEVGPHSRSSSRCPYGRTSQLIEYLDHKVLVATSRSRNSARTAIRKPNS